jgi:hypothetical protein
LCTCNSVAIFLVADIKGRYLLLAQKLKRWVMGHRGFTLWMALWVVL